MKRLSGQRALEDRGGQCVQLEAKPVDVPLGQRGRWTQLGEQALEPVPNLAERGQVTREVGERRMQSPQRTAEFPWLRRRSLLVVWDELPQRHPQPVLLVRPRRQDVARRNDQVGPLGQEGPDGHLARQPLLGVIVQDRRPGHHPCHNRCGLQMHQYVAARRDPHCLVAGHAVLTGNGLRGRERRGFAGCYDRARDARRATARPMVTGWLTSVVRRPASDLESCASPGCRKIVAGRSRRARRQGVLLEEEKRDHPARNAARGGSRASAEVRPSTSNSTMTASSAWWSADRVPLVGKRRRDSAK